MPEREPEQAVVLGGGVGGLLAAAALQNHFDEVLIFERDAIPEQPVSRRGVPQDEQLHNLLGRAQAGIEELLPGTLSNLRVAGAGQARVADQTHVHDLGIAAPERNVGLTLMSAWRPVIEHELRKRLLESGRVAIHGLSKAVGLKLSRASRVQGVRIEWGEGTLVVPTKLVVDATGTNSAASRWLEDYGTQTPPTETRRVDQWYASTIFERPEEYANCDEFWLSFPFANETRGGLVSPIDGQRWYLSLSGRAKDQPPKTVDEVLAYAKTLGDDSAITRLIDGATALTVPNVFRKTNVVVRRYDMINNHLHGLLPLGDSLASLNPLFGQGMSVAAWQATSLNELLREYRLGDIKLRELTSQYIGRATTAAWAALNLDIVIDRNILGPETNPERIQRRVDVLNELLWEDPEFHRRYVRIWHLLEPANLLQDSELQDRLNRVC